MATKIQHAIRLVKQVLGLGRLTTDVKFLNHVAGLAREEVAYSFGQKSEFLQENILLSVIVPVFDTRLRFLYDLIKSLPNEPMKKYYEIIFVDDGSKNLSTKLFLKNTIGKNTRVVYLKNNRGPSEAQNAGLKEARGTYFTILDHDDAVFSFGIEKILLALNYLKDAQLLYTDEILINENGLCQGLFLKPAWDRVLLSGVNYINHFCVFKTERARTLGGYRSQFDGSHDYEFLLRYTKDLPDSDIFHLPYPAYQWRVHKNSLSQIQKNAAIKRARAALVEYFVKDKCYPSNVTIAEANIPDIHRPLFPISGDDLVSIIIPVRDHADLTEKVVEGIFKKTDYQNIEVIIVDNGSKEVKTHILFDQLQRQNVKILKKDGPFNYSGLINCGVSQAKGQYLLFLNNDIEIIHSDWVQEMLQCFSFPNTGIVGAKLLYPNRKIQHAGVITGFGDLAGHWYEGEPSEFPGPMGRLAVRQTMSAVTGACMLVSRECFEAVGGLNEVDFAVAYNDIDFCLRAQEKGYKTVWTPFSELFHHESATRGSDATPENLPRFQQEQERLKRRHRTHHFRDPTINPWFSRDRSHPQPVLYDTLMKPRNNSLEHARDVQE